MTRELLENRIRRGVFFLDGAMGTQLFARGARSGECNELLNVENPAVVEDVHRAYLEAGSDAVLTNTFGGSAVALRRHGLAERTVELNRAGAELARGAAGPDRYVIGDIGPCGDFLEPLGTLTPPLLKEAFARQVEGLLEGEVDGFIIETMTALEEVEIAIEAVRGRSSVPIFVSLSYDPASGGAFRTMMGVSPEQAVERLGSQPIQAIGFNCGTLDMDGYAELARRSVKALDGSRLLLLAEPNAGKPRLEGNKAVYDLSPERFAEFLDVIRGAGARLLGGCCGTTPDHIRAAAAKCRQP
jgi:5-methyltetrahydrofolate--homocysteine methyltransferase